MDEEILKEYGRNVQAMINDLNLEVMHLKKRITYLEGQLSEVLDDRYKSKPIDNNWENEV